MAAPSAAIMASVMCVTHTPFNTCLPYEAATQMAEWLLLSMSALTGCPRASCCLLEPRLPWLAYGSVPPGCTQLTASRLGSDIVSLPLNVFMTVLLNTLGGGAGLGLVLQGRELAKHTGGSGFNP